MLILVLVIIFLIFFVYHKFQKRIVCDLPGPKPYPLTGNAHLYLSEEPLHVLHNLQNQFGNIFQTYLGSNLYVILSDPTDIEAILTSYKHTSKSYSYNFAKEWLGNGLITSCGDTWHAHRKFLTPTFHFKILENSIEIMRENSKILVQQLASKAADGKDFEVHSIIEKCSLDIISEVAMNVKLNTQTNNDNDKYLQAVKNATNLSIERVFKLWLQPDILFRWFGSYKKYKKSVDTILMFFTNIIVEKAKTHEIFPILLLITVLSVIASKRRQIEKSRTTADEVQDDGNSKKKSFAPFLDSMLLDSNFTDDEIHDEVMSFMFAGHDSITCSLSFCLYVLAKYQDIQEKVYQEIMEILPSDECPTIQTLNNLKYTTNVIKESFRLYPPVAIIGRTILEPVAVPSGYTIPANTQLNIFIYGMHRCAKYFPQPEKFIPERFNPENKRHPFSYIPFSAGPRNCIGQKLAMLEMKMLIIAFVKNYKLLPAEKSESLKLFFKVVLRSEGGIPIRIIKRT